MTSVDALTIHLRTTLVVRTLPSGAVLSSPVSALALASVGPLGHCVDEQQLFLSEHLARATPEDAARFHLPEGVRLVSADVLVAREDLPRRLRIRTPLRMHAVVIPDARGAWVTVVALDHTFYVPSDEPVEKALRDEVTRVAGAWEITPEQYLRLLPPERVELVPMELSVERMERLPPGRVASLRKALRDRERQKWAREVLATVATPMHEVTPRVGPPLGSREHELRQLSGLLDSARKRSVLLTGPSLAGKTALVHAWLRARLARDPSACAYATSGSQLIAGMSGLGQWEERVRRVMEAAEVLDAVLYFDNLGDLLAERASSHVDMPGAMKVWVEEGRVRLVGELRSELVDQAERMHGSLLSAMARVRVDPLDAARTAEALRGRVAWDREHEPDRPRLSPEAVHAVVDLAERYLPYEAFPGKVLRLYDELRALAEAKRGPSDRSRAELGPDDAHAFFSMKSGIPLFLLREDTALRLDDVIASLRARMVGQGVAVRRVAETVCVVKARLQPTGRPLATLLFVGPTGVGKTELARAVAALLFGAEERMVRFDMSEFTDMEAADRLLRGTGGAEGLLTRRVREQPFGVVLLDEIEKAHPSVFDLLLQVCGEGRLTDGRGRTAYFHNAILIMTSNLGASSLREPAGFSALPDDPTAHYQRAVDRHFRPEFVNRLDRVVAFGSLSPDEILSVARIALGRVAARRGFLGSGSGLRVGDAALATLAREGYSLRYGARALRRHLEDHLVAPVARALCAITPGNDLLAVDVAAQGDSLAPPEGMVEVYATSTKALSIKVFRAYKSDAHHAQVAFDRVSEVRRAIDRARLWPRVTALGEQLEFVVLQLDHGRAAEGRAGAAHRTSVELASLQSEHHRLEAVWAALGRHRDEIFAVESLALGGFFEGQPIEELRDEAEAIRARWERDMARALLAQEPRRDGVTLMVTELDERRGFDRWLVPLLEECERRGWHAMVHVDGERPGERDEWPTDRRWGPPRSREQARERVVDPERSFRNALITVEGPWAGGLLALEAGLHAWALDATRRDDDHCVFVRVRLLAMRASIGAKQWGHPSLVPETPNAWAELRKGERARDHYAEGSVFVRGSGLRDLDTPAKYFAELERVASLDLAWYERNDELNRDERFVGPLDDALAEGER